MEGGRRVTRREKKKIDDGNSGVSEGVGGEVWSYIIRLFL